MLEERPGAYLYIGNGDGDDANGRPLHNPGYDLNDSILPLGSSLLTKLVKRKLSRAG